MNLSGATTPSITDTQHNGIKCDTQYDSIKRTFNSDGTMTFSVMTLSKNI
jgi:hypothetical protein